MKLGFTGGHAGFNEAFVIDEKTRAELVEKNPQSAELIKPWLRGKDIRRWYADYQNIYVISIASGSNRAWPWSDLTPEKAEQKFKKEHPSVYRHLAKHKAALIARDDQGQYWWELRSCAYIQKFDQPKIVFNETSKKLHAFFDQSALCIKKTGFIILTDNAKYLLGILNSALMDYFYRSTFPSWGDPWKEGRIQFRGNRMAEIAIPSASADVKNQNETLVTRILETKKADPTADTTALEAEIDQLVYQLYGLTPEEIAMVEAATAPAPKKDKPAPAAGKTATAKPRPGRPKKAALPKALPDWD